MVLSCCSSNKRKEAVIQDQNYEGKKRVASFPNSVSTKTSDSMRDECICEGIYIYICVQEDSSKGSVGYNVAIGCRAINGRMAACSNLFCDRNPTAPMWHGRREGEGKREGGAMACACDTWCYTRHALSNTCFCSKTLDCFVCIKLATFSFSNSKRVILLSCVCILCSLSRC